MSHVFTDLPEIYAQVYEAVDTAASMRTSSPRAEATVQRALGQFRRSGADAEALAQLETMSLQLNELRSVTFDGDHLRQVTATQGLSHLADKWIWRLPIHSH